MGNTEAQGQFEEEVFPAELEEIRRRREAVGLDASGLTGRPSVDLDLYGLAFSGGGIRSATFCLGVLEAAANAGLLKRADYLSTVSGGGFIGSCLSSVLNDPEKEPQGRAFPFHHELGVPEPEAYRQLRNGTNYLAPGGILDKLRLPALVLRGIVLNFLLFLPLVMVAVLLTEVVYELGTRSPFDMNFLPLVAFSIFLGLIVLFPIVARVQRRWLGWRRRDLYERLLAGAFATALVLLVFLPLTLLVVGAAGSSWEGFREAALAELQSPFEGRDYWKWLLVLLAFVAFLFVGQASERVGQVRGRVLLYLVGLIGPGVLFVIYLVMCVYQLDSPFLEKDFAETLDRGELTAPLRDELGQRGVALGPEAEVIVEKPGEIWAIRDGDDEHRISSRHTFLRIDTRDFWDGESDVVFLAILVGLTIFVLLFMDVNLTSPHGFYRDRLSRVFMFRVSSDGEIEPHDDQKLSDLNAPGTKAPYHLINT
ncbi:MAG: patatin-like phospholipase family protein, partial [Myxococcota bacterium]